MSFDEWRARSRIPSSPARRPTAKATPYRAIGFFLHFPTLVHQHGGGDRTDGWTRHGIAPKALRDADGLLHTSAFVSNKWFPSDWTETSPHHHLYEWGHDQSIFMTMGI
jgi:hypothetical protein